MIKRTTFANTPRAATWINSPVDWTGAHGYADTVFDQEYPSHSPVLGPDGNPLQYEPRQPIGFRLAD